MKKILLSLGVVGVFAFYSFHQREEKRAALNNVNVVPLTTRPTVVPSGIPTIVQQNSKYKDGEYTGSVADAFYGPLQVKAIISGGKLVDVQFLQYPNDRPTSTQISNASMPVLKQEAIKAQNAKVDIVTGATQTSEAFVQTLQSALDKAS